jgi:hypothetical protein
MKCLALAPGRSDAATLGHRDRFRALRHAVAAIHPRTPFRYPRGDQEPTLPDAAPVAGDPRSGCLLRDPIRKRYHLPVIAAGRKGHAGALVPSVCPLARERFGDVQVGRHETERGPVAPEPLREEAGCGIRRGLRLKLSQRGNGAVARMGNW